MLLNDEHERPAPPLDWHGSRLRCSFEFALGGVFAELVFGHGEILGEMPCGCWRARAATPTRSGREISTRRTSNRMPCWPGTANSCRASRSITPSRSEEHTSELQSPYDLVCRLLLEKK